ncbi:hypothetical protein DFH08DRAFT_889261 [Mycena albidolilacea]|uniref:Uncharacterized protein n=1 Tax=Mycena albidolilacea TaxID=1033008 RepID=A0AAD7EGK9_9AGAR|nr:hypothetical protein DFH08DRAFT_889261 [Mycena albidolilacea]
MMTCWVVHHLITPFSIWCTAISHIVSCIYHLLSPLSPEVSKIYLRAQQHSRQHQDSDEGNHCQSEEPEEDAEVDTAAD